VLPCPGAYAGRHPTSNARLVHGDRGGASRSVLSNRRRQAAARRGAHTGRLQRRTQRGCGRGSDRDAPGTSTSSRDSPGTWMILVVASATSFPSKRLRISVRPTIVALGIRSFCAILVSWTRSIPAMASRTIDSPSRSKRFGCSRTSSAPCERKRLAIPRTGGRTRRHRADDHRIRESTLMDARIDIRAGMAPCDSRMSTDVETPAMCSKRTCTTSAIAAGRDRARDREARARSRARAFPRGRRLPEMLRQRHGTRMPDHRSRTARRVGRSRR
jgi:hypothetical protein